MWCSSVPCQHIFQSMWQHESQFRIKLRLISVVSSSDFEKSMFCFYVSFTAKLACCHSFATKREMGFSNLPVSSYSSLELFLMWTEHMSECSWRHKIVLCCFGAQRLFTGMFPYLQVALFVQDTAFFVLHSWIRYFDAFVCLRIVVWKNLQQPIIIRWKSVLQYSSDPQRFWNSR